MDAQVLAMEAVMVVLEPAQEDAQAVAQVVHQLALMGVILDVRPQQWFRRRKGK